MSSIQAFLREQAQKIEFGYALLQIDEVALRLDRHGEAYASTVLSRPSRAPYVAEHPELCLSISHSNAYAVAVIAAFQIGMDLEQIESRPAAFADTFFCPNELALLHEHGASQAEIDAWITRLWSRKEAVSSSCNWVER